MSSPDPVVMYSENEQKLRLLGLVDDSENFINNATVTLTIVDGKNQVVGGIQNVTMSSIDSLGDYEYLILASTFTPTPGLPGYTAIIQASLAGVPKYKVYKRLTIAKRES